MSRKILVLDTTLRDGEQVPGAKLNLYEKLELAHQLKALNVDIIEAGFAASSQGDFNAIKEIASQVGSGSTTITALARAVKGDIDAVYQSVKYAQHPLIHIVLGTSAVHVDKKFNKTGDQVLEMGVEAVKYAKSLLPHIQYSTEDASRSDFEYLWKTIEAVIKAGATMINIPDTVGYAVPEEFGELVRKINYRLKNMSDSLILSVHCHNDTGLATANTLAAIKNGADKIECTVNGLGERAGNAALEEVVMAMKLRSAYYDAHTDIITKEIFKTSRLVSNLTGLDIQVNKAITGDNAFAHSSGIHQDGLLKSREVYEVIAPEDVGVESMDIILTARSGRHAFRNAAEKLGCSFSDEAEFEALFAKFLELADAKKEIYDHDVYYLVEKHNGSKSEKETGGDMKVDLYELVSFEVVSNDIFPTATIKLKKGGDIFKYSAVGDGPIDALYTAIKDVTGLEVDLKEYKISSMSRGKEALGRVAIRIGFKDKIYTARAMDTDVIKASALAFINGLNAILLDR